MPAIIEEALLAAIPTLAPAAAKALSALFLLTAREFDQISAKPPDETSWAKDIISGVESNEANKDLTQTQRDMMSFGAIQQYLANH